MTHTSTQQPEVLSLEEFRAKVTHAAREPLLTRISELEAQLAATEEVPVVPQGVNAPNEWEEIRTLPTCDDLIWLYCQDTNTIDGPIAPEPNLEEYGWSHWAYANAPSTAWIDTAQAKQGELP